MCIGAEKRAVFLVSNRDQRSLATLKSNPIWSWIQNLYVSICRVAIRNQNRKINYPALASPWPPIYGDAFDRVITLTAWIKNSSRLFSYFFLQNIQRANKNWVQCSVLKKPKVCNVLAPLKLRYAEKANKIWKLPNMFCRHQVSSKKIGRFFQTVLAFSEYLNSIDK